MARSGWAALAATVLLVAGLGNEPALDAAADADRQVAPLLRSLTVFPAWSTSALGFDSDMYTAIAVKIVVLLVLVFVLGRAAGHVGASFAAFLAGWGALMVAGAVAGVAYVLVADMAVLDGQLADSQGGAGAVVVDGLNTGAVFGLYTGWLVGALVVVTARPGGLQAAGGWRASPPSRTLPVPPAGTTAAATAGVGPPMPAPDALAEMNLVPGMPSVTSPGRAGAGAPDPWAQAAPEPVVRAAAADLRDPLSGQQAGADQAAPAWAAPSSPAAPDAGDPWGPQPLSDPAARAAPAKGPWAPQLQSTADAASAGRGAMGEPGPWGTPPGPEASTEGQPFVPPGSWRRPPGDTVGALPTAETPAVPPAGRPPSAPAEPQPPAAAPRGPIVPSGTWPPSARSEPDAPAGTGPQAGPTVSWPPSTRDQQATNGGAPPPSYEQPEYSGLAPGTSGHAGAPEPPAQQAPAQAPTAAAGSDVEAGQPTRPLWPSAWPASSGGAYADEQGVSATDQAGPRSPDSDDEDAAGDSPDTANTRFW